jgi:xylulokinase
LILQLKQASSDHNLVLAIDLGTSGAKVGLVDLQGQVIACAAGSYEPRFLPGGGVEQDPREWWSVIVGATRDALAQAGVTPEKIIAAGVTSQWSVTVPLDANGEPLMNAISWMDSRGGVYNKKLVGGFPSLQGYQAFKLFQWISKTGNAPTLSGADALGHMLFIKHTLPEIYQKTDTFLEPMDYINFRLTGRRCATQNSAFASMMIDNRRLGNVEYDPKLLKMGGIERSKLPELLPVDGIVGNLIPQAAEQLGLTTSTVVISGAGDNSTSVIGAGAVADFEAVAVLGTSGYLAFHLPAKKTDVMHMITTMPSALPDRYLFLADTGNTGRVVDSYLNNLVYGEDCFFPAQDRNGRYEAMDQIAGQAPPGSQGVLFMPYFMGSLAPCEDPTMRGGFLNLSNTTTRQHLTRALLEGIAYNWRWLRDAAEGLVRRKFPYWRLSGGGALSPVWCQIMADVMGIPMHQQSDPRNNNVLGIGLLAFNRLGYLLLDEIPEMVKINQVFEPHTENQAVYDRMYRQFRTCYKRLQPVYQEMNQRMITK